MVVYRTFRFHSARHLPQLDDSHKCKKMHGHTFNLTVYIEGDINKINGFIIDFYDIDKIVNDKIISRIDHKILNDVPNLINPTSEHLCKWIWNQLYTHFDILKKIVLSEDHGTGIVYTGD